LMDFAKTQKNYAALVFGERPLQGDHVFCLPLNPETAAASLYDVLHQMDALQVEQLLVAMPPNQPEWLAIRDRLSRAAPQLN